MPDIQARATTKGPVLEPVAEAVPQPVWDAPIESIRSKLFDFDEEDYLSANPDVARAVQAGAFGSGKEHYNLHGWREERPLSPPPGSEAAEPPEPPDTIPYAVPPTQAEPPPDPFEDLTALYAGHHDANYLTPRDLTQTRVFPKKIALVGSCFLQDLWLNERPGCNADLLTVNNAEPLPDNAAAYDLQIVQVPFRSVMPDAVLWHLPANDPMAFQDAFEESRARLMFQLTGLMEWNKKHGLLSFVCNFFMPQHNPLGVLQPKYDYRNIEYFVDQLNMHLELMVRGHRNAYILDVDRIAGSFGRRYVQDDNVALFAHNGLMPTDEALTDRMEPVGPMSEYYAFDHDAVRDAIWNEIVTMFRVVRQVDAVKLVVVDLDDTLWRGISGDIADVGPEMIERWPLGFVEALTYLKKRGILLAIVSKNEEARIREIWPHIFGEGFTLDDFAMVMINWRPKAENMRHVLETINLLPRNTVFIDDNPAERAAMQVAYPEIRVLGRHPYYLRRVLLWSSETQVSSVNDELARRTEMVQAQVEREQQRQIMTRADFLANAAPRAHLVDIFSEGHPRFPRAFELLNKTNQFNTTGRRWTAEEMRAFLNDGGTMHTFEVKDRYTDYGLVGVVLTHRGSIAQWVMSCRVLGYQIEEAVMITLMQQAAKSGVNLLSATLLITETNFPCRDLFARCGFDKTDISEREFLYWQVTTQSLPAMPAHIIMTA